MEVIKKKEAKTEIKLLTALSAKYTGADIKQAEEMLNNIYKFIDSLPTFEIVTCKQCKEFKEPWCLYHERKTMDDDFCNYGEKNDK